MYLSKVLLGNTAVGNCSSLRLGILNCFGDSQDAARDFLYRVEKQHPGRGIEILLQSCRQPVSCENRWVLASKHYVVRLAAGAYLRFYCLAQPATQRRVDGKKRKCRTPLLKDSDRLHWFRGKFQGVADFQRLTVMPGPTLYFSKMDGSKRVNGHFQTARFQGSLQVLVPEAFVKMLAEGIGPGKAFGCGMISIAPA